MFTIFIYVFAIYTLQVVQKKLAFKSKKPQLFIEKGIEMNG